MMHFQVLGLWEKTKQSKTDAFCSSLGTFKYAVQTGSIKLVPVVLYFKVNSTSLGSIMAWWYLEMFVYTNQILRMFQSFILASIYK